MQSVSYSALHLIHTRIPLIKREPYHNQTVRHVISVKKPWLTRTITSQWH